MELDNFLDHGDEGEIWFGKAVERRTIDWIKSKLPNLLLKSSSSSAPSTEARILDLGCGNGHFTCKLLEAGFINVAALDYSEKAVELARNLIKNSLNSSSGVSFDQFNPLKSIFQADILDSESIPEAFRNSFDLVVDKGTFDAISLNPDIVGEERTSKTFILASSFKRTLKKLLDPLNPFFIITSCNWTSAELGAIFGPEFVAIDEVAHSTFTFGGKSGQDVSTVIFKLIDCPQG